MYRVVDDTNPFQLHVHDVVQFIFDDTELHHCVGTEDRPAESQAGIVRTPPFMPLRHHLRSHTLTS